MTLRDSKGRYVRQTGAATPKASKAKKSAKVAPAVKKAVTTPKKNYIGISRDHSGSMSHIAIAAARDYNNNIKSIQEANLAEKQDTIVSVVKCGVGSHGTVERETINSTVAQLQPLTENMYKADGGATPLFKSINELIDILEAAPDAKDPNVSFLVMAITDGQDNASGHGAAQLLTTRINALQATDHWTFIFRVPHGYKQSLVRMGIPEGNILEWEQTTRGVEIASQATNTAFRSFYSARSAGETMTKAFYTTDMSGVSKATVKAKLVDISGEVNFFDITTPAVIKVFVENATKKPLVTGAAFYQLTKKEDEVQDYKQIAIRDKKTSKVYSGVEARNILGLPHNGTVKVAPGNHGTYDIFIQSTSVNRKLMPGTQLLYWSKVSV
jgi:hypothetical protein